MIVKTQGQLSKQKLLKHSILKEYNTKHTNTHLKKQRWHHNHCVLWFTHRHGKIGYLQEICDRSGMEYWVSLYCKCQTVVTWYWYIWLCI